METSRRGFLKSSGLLLTFMVGGKTLLLSPSEAHARKLPLQELSDSQAATLEALAEALIPGARAAGITHYLDSQLHVDPEKSLLMIRYLGVPAPYQAFYTSGLDSVARLCQSRYGKSFAALNSQQTTNLINDLSRGEDEGWQGPPSAFFYFVLRSDAADVVYGTKAGFDHLAIPYMPHIFPKQPW